MAFLVLMVKHYLSNKHKIHKRKGLLTFSLFFLILVNLNHKLNAQEQFQYGFIGGLNMSTITAKNHDSGFKMGFNIGGVAQYLINNNSCIAANLNLSSKGQQFSKIEENSLNYLKIYHSTTLYYIDIPLLYQYYVKDIIGLEIGPTLGFCLSGRDKTKIGNESWNINKFEKDLYNPFELGLTVGIFTHDLTGSEFNNVFIEIRYFIGLTNFISDYNRNYNNGILINIGYIIKKPLKKRS